jgi:hypothetical protein
LTFFLFGGAGVRSKIKKINSPPAGTLFPFKGYPLNLTQIGHLRVSMRVPHFRYPQGPATFKPRSSPLGMGSSDISPAKIKKIKENPPKSRHIWSWVFASKWVASTRNPLRGKTLSMELLSFYFFYFCIVTAVTHVTRIWHTLPLDMRSSLGA